jgi:aromatic amino acid aminotransferase I
MLDALSKHVPSECAELPQPRGGMFFWLRLKVESHPQLATKSLTEIMEDVFQACITERIVVVPSPLFKSPRGKDWTKDEEARRMYLRLSYAMPSEPDIEEGVKRLAAALKKQWGL